jgi:uroporphyrin-III C-methyltransferase
METGFVSLVGAGPFGPDLLTLKALRRLQEADVILYDALVAESTRALFPHGTLAVSVGKRCGRHAMAQAEINRLLIRLARRGRRVVRLKGGDPYVFGRGGEEALALARAGIPFEVVPGVSSVAAVGALAGIPLTHRGLSQSAQIIQGHELDQTTDWSALARFAGTLVVLMGVGAVQEIAARLVAHGAEAARQIALVETAPDLQLHRSTSTLGEVAVHGLARRTAGPGIIYIGAVVGLARELAALGLEASSQLARSLP